jgi:hypothetical protein
MTVGLTALIRMPFSNSMAAFMKRVNQVISSEQIAHLADAEPTGMAGRYGRRGNLSNGYFLHLSHDLHESGKVATLQYRQCPVRFLVRATAFFRQMAPVQILDHTGA